MKTILTAIIAITLLSRCNGLGRDSDDAGTGAGNDTMQMQTHGIDLHPEGNTMNQISDTGHVNSTMQGDTIHSDTINLPD